jgi:hypothetical protein
MKQVDADRLDKLAVRYRAEADYCRHMAERAVNRSSKDEWVRLAASWTKLAEDAKGRSQPIDDGFSDSELAADESISAR